MFAAALTATSEVFDEVLHLLFRGFTVLTDGTHEVQDLPGKGVVGV